MLARAVPPPLWPWPASQLRWWGRELRGHVLLVSGNGTRGGSSAGGGGGKGAGVTRMSTGRVSRRLRPPRPTTQGSPLVVGATWVA